MNTWTIFKRELTSYFTQPTAYAIVVIFGFLSTLLAFTLGNFWGIGDASLYGSFFRFHPLLLMILVPAVSMRQWSDEHATGTIELLGTFPIKLRSAILGKFLVCCTFLAITTLVSAFTRDQVVALIASVAICCFLTICGWEPVINEIRRSGSTNAVNIMTDLGIYSHFFDTTLGLIRATSLIYFFGLITVCLVGTNMVLKSQRA